MGVQESCHSMLWAQMDDIQNVSLNDLRAHGGRGHARAPGGTGGASRGWDYQKGA